MIYILLVVIIVELGIDLYFHFRKLPDEVRKELVRSVVKSEEGRVIEYIPPEDEEDKASKELTELITKE